ncbi:hypothetical protein EV182_001147, partial [Spiromyces aspiralis]
MARPRTNSPGGQMAGTLACPICSVQAPNLFVLNMHLDEAHFGGTKDAMTPPTAADGGDANSQRQPTALAAQDSLEDVGDAIFGLIKKTGLGLRGLGVSLGGVAGNVPLRDPGPSNGSNKPQAMAVESDGATLGRVTKAHWKPDQAGDR